MIVTLFISSLYGGGAERVTCNLASHLARNGHDVTILTMSETKESYGTDKRVKITSLLPIESRKTWFWNSIIRFPRLWSFLFKNKNDVYVVMLAGPTILLLLFRWMTKAKIITAERVDPTAYSKITSFFLKRCFARADGTVFQTEDERDWYGKRIKMAKTTIIPNAINEAFLRPLCRGKKKKHIVGVGRLNDQKNFSLLIKAFALVSEDYPEYDLIIYGEGKKRDDLERLVKEKGLNDHIFLPGNITNIAETLEKVSLFVLSSDYEGMPNALMEAMALGIPCISTDCPCGGSKFLIDSGKNGILVPVRDVDAMANAMRKLLSDMEYSEQIGKNAADIRTKLSPDRIYGQWESFIQEVVNKKN